jgi:acyl carrier protein
VSQATDTEISRAHVTRTLVGMITEVLGEDDFGIEAGMSFKDDIGFKSIQFIALAELIQDKYENIDFVTWFSAKPLPEIVALRVGDVADFIVASSPPG